MSSQLPGRAGDGVFSTPGGSAGRRRMRSPSLSPQAPSPTTTSSTPLAGSPRPVRKKNRHISPSAPAASARRAIVAPHPRRPPPEGHLAQHLPPPREVKMPLAKLHTTCPDFDIPLRTTSLLDKLASLRASFSEGSPPPSRAASPVRDDPPQKVVQETANPPPPSAPAHPIDPDNLRAKGHPRRVIVRPVSQPPKGASPWPKDVSPAQITSKINADFVSAHRVEVGHDPGLVPVSGAYFTRNGTLILLTIPSCTASHLINHVGLHDVVLKSLHSFVSVRLCLEVDQVWQDVVVQGYPTQSGKPFLSKWSEDNRWINDFKGKAVIKRWRYLSPAGQDPPAYCAVQISVNDIDLAKQLVRKGVLCGGVHCKVTPYRRRARPKGPLAA
ncbi:hypothetical protein EIP91_010441 [Steccherinum ochraceum]|uniref:Uncharacterized protein n=1 Tax=Steccherinum ochraceum TaxID=92696 RepID=A0A4V6N702_9APHY|nr:hypothetical protein EIP91_010441 [Steccherinum ochraceum]